MRHFIGSSTFICFYSHFQFQLLRCICVQVNTDNINWTNKACLLWTRCSSGLWRCCTFFHECNSENTAHNILYVMWRCCLATWHPVCVQSMLMSWVAGVSGEPPEQSRGLCNICNENAETMTFPCTALRRILHIVLYYFQSCGAVVLHSGIWRRSQIRSPMGTTLLFTPRCSIHLGWLISTKATNN